MNYLDKYKEWISSKNVDEKTKEELLNITDEKEIEDRFYKNLEFGTGGLRGVMASGTNRMNIYTIAKTTMGLAIYLKEKYGEDATCIVAYDSRNNSKEFAKESALVLAAVGVKAFLFESLRPTPMLSFAVREIRASGGINITASHNPMEYNGYKVYGPTGGQLTDNDAKIVLEKINELNDLEGIKKISEEEALKLGKLEYIGEFIDRKYYESIKSVSFRKDMIKENAEKLNIIYTPIHGSGNIPVRRVLKELGYTNVSVVKEQEKPDGNFPTANFPNPEYKEVFNLAIKLSETMDNDIIFGTDPDSDRIGVVVKDNSNNLRVLSGNETGILLANYIAESVKESLGTKKGAMIKTIVTTEMARKICENYGIELFDVLTGFKYIGEMMDKFKSENSYEFLLGFEESYGYLAGDHARDKDAVIAAMLVSEMALYYKLQGKSLNDVLEELYNKYGYYKDNIVSMEFKGIEGIGKMNKIIDGMRSDIKEKLITSKIVRKEDYLNHTSYNIKENTTEKIDLPKSNVLKYFLEDGSSFVVRPSGTEPKMKIYLSVVSKDKNESSEKFENLKKEVEEFISRY